MTPDPTHTATDLVFAELSSFATTPWRLTEIASWHEHIPFAFWLIRSLRPARLVELGVHKGDSYSAFCQAVKEAALPTACFGVDTWRGEEHAGFYDESVWLDYSEYHDRHFTGFSRLIRATFDEALPYFEDGSVELLHIDGRHLYEDVRHDYESWLPKLAPSGVVLFHDINVRERDFGVWRFWDELCARHPGRTFSFIHGHGLGVLFPGAQPPALAARLCRLDTAGVHYVRTAFATLGKSIGRQAEVAHWRRYAQGLESRLMPTEKRLMDTEQRCQALELRLAQAEQRAVQLAGDADELARLRTAAEARAHAAEARVHGAEQQAEAAHARCAELERRSAEILQSTSWRMTRPIRQVGQLLKGGSKPT